MNGHVDIAANLAQVQHRIEAAAQHAGRDPTEVTLVAVTKTQPLEVVQAAYEAGMRHFGENRVEEGRTKIPLFSEWLSSIGLDVSQPARWHMIGHVQHRKAADTLTWFDLTHSVDSLKLAERLNRLASLDGPAVRILLECNVSGEESKSGFPLSRWQTKREVRDRFFDVVRRIIELPRLSVQGLMTMAPLAADPEETRPVFAALRSLRDALGETFPTTQWQHLSMGMTDDFEVAVEEGATLVRIGRAIFGGARVHH
jgi:pyridoxal phosphate enzyme (YggS family)